MKTDDRDERAREGFSDENSQTLEHKIFTNSKSASFVRHPSGESVSFLYLTLLTVCVFGILGVEM